MISDRSKLHFKQGLRAAKKGRPISKTIRQDENAMLMLRLYTILVKSMK